MINYVRSKSIWTLASAIRCRRRSCRADWAVHSTLTKRHRLGCARRPARQCPSAVDSHHTEPVGRKRFGSSSKSRRRHARRPSIARWRRRREHCNRTKALILHAARSAERPGRQCARGRLGLWWGRVGYARLIQFDPRVAADFNVNRLCFTAGPRSPRGKFNLN